jgi:hypothetical protein
MTNHDEDPARAADVRDDDRRSPGATAHVLRRLRVRGEARCEADLVGAVERVDMVVRSVRMSKLDFLGERSLRAAVPRWHDITRGTRERKQLAENAQPLGL